VELDELLAASMKQDGQAWAILGQLTDLLTSRTLANAERLEELAGDVAELGTRVSQLEHERRNESSLRVVGREHFTSLDELAAVLRAEVADELAAIDKRITEVHDPALRALTALVERKPTA
jgi:hypothetical protein